jgi:cytochrome b561
MTSVAGIRRYGSIAQLLHWMTVLMVIVAWTLGVFGDDRPKGDTRAAWLVLHMSVGFLILVAVVMRLAWRVVDPPPPSEDNEFGRWLGRFADPAARLGHVVLYALLIAVPVVGIVAQFARGDSLPLFGAIDIRSPWDSDRVFAHKVTEIHEMVAHALVIVACFHGTAAFIHHFVFSDHTLARMLPPRVARSQETPAQEMHGE